MAITRVDYPTDLTNQADFSAHGELIEVRYLDQSYAPQLVVSGEIPQGVVFQIGGVVYRADSDTAITGTTSDYVRIVPAGASATAEYVANLSGVTWSTVYNGYYSANNLYVFDEGAALAAGEISAVFGRYLAQQPNGDVHVGNTLHAESIEAGSVETAGVEAGADLTLSGSLYMRNPTFGEQGISPQSSHTMPEGVYLLSIANDNATAYTRMNGSSIAVLRGQPVGETGETDIGIVIANGGGLTQHNGGIVITNDEPLGGANVLARWLKF